MIHAGLSWHKLHRPHVSVRALAGATVLALAVGAASTPSAQRYFETQFESLLRYEGTALSVDKASFCRTSHGLC
jgi:hypothetical protein